MLPVVADMLLVLRDASDVSCVDLYDAGCCTSAFTSATSMDFLEAQHEASLPMAALSDNHLQVVGVSWTKKR